MKTRQQLLDMEFERDACKERRAEIRQTITGLKKELGMLEDRIDELDSDLDEADEAMEAQRLAEVA